jgi:hypothetical protein
LFMDMLNGFWKVQRSGWLVFLFYGMGCDVM